MTLALARRLAAREGQDFNSLPRDRDDLRSGNFPGRTRDQPFKCDYVALARARRGVLHAVPKLEVVG